MFITTYSIVLVSLGHLLKQSYNQTIVLDNVFIFVELG